MGETKAKEQPTDVDVRIMFGKMRKPMEALQSLFVAALNELNSNGIDTSDAKLEIKDGELTVRLGDYVMWLSVRENIFKIGG